jgi:mannose-6-phosphate isomerase-like protein (cupin superfamily)
MCLTHSGEREHLVIHRQTEEKGEDHERDVRRHGAGRGDVPQRRPVTLPKTSTTMPNAAANDRRFSTTALSASTTERDEWIYVLSGHMRFILGDEDWVLGPGEVAEFRHKGAALVREYGRRTCRDSRRGTAPPRRALPSREPGA